MRYRIMGRTDLRVSEIGFGARRVGRNTDDQESIRAIHRAIDLGINFFDTADSYGDGHSEELFAQVLKTRRHEMVLSTKGGELYMAQPRRRSFEPDYITSALEASLRRLQTDTIDLYQLHNGTPEAVKSGGVMERLERHKQEGKVRFYGVSLWDDDDGLEIVQSGKPDTLQVIYSILHQQPQEKLFALAQQKNIGIIARVPLERGILTGRLTSYSSLTPDHFSRGTFSPEEFAKLMAALDKLQFLVKRDVENLGEAALRFCLSHPAVSTVIPGMQRVANVEANARASKGPLPEEDLVRLRELYQSEFRHIDFH